VNTLFFKHLLEVERTGSISRAADNLFMAQPNLSKEIKEIEIDIGFALFNRTSKGVLPTPQGKKYLAYARNIVRQLERLDSLSQPEQLNAQIFSIAMPRFSYLSQALTSFISRLNLGVGLDIRARETNAVQTINYLEDGWCNLGIIRYNVKYEPAFYDLVAGKN
jgi:DNA-binding transcriptional LysR family regulator